MNYYIITETNWAKLRDEILSLAECCHKAFGEKSKHTDWQHTRITIMLQGALADVQQPAHIPVVQPVRVLAFLSECLVAAFRKAQDFIPKLCPIGFRNDVIVHNHILLLFIVSGLSCFHRQR